jgi:hypothetical protein
MKKKVAKIVKLKNLYNLDIVYTTGYDEVVMKENIPFIYVYYANKPDRKFLVCKNSFAVLE